MNASVSGILPNERDVLHLTPVLQSVMLREEVAPTVQKVMQKRLSASHTDFIHGDFLSGYRTAFHAPVIDDVTHRRNASKRRVRG